MQATPKAIEIQGIVRNATVIGAQDGQAEDLINLRFMDGSWRASGDGRLINFTMGAEYTQLYVHTNVYHHLLGVNNGTLYWFAEIDNDGVTFYPLDGTTDRSQWSQDMQSLPTSPVALTTVVGDIWISQNGHLLTIIDENDDFEHFIYKTGDKEYINVEVDVNGKKTARGIYPFGQVHFNLYSPSDDDHKFEKFVDQSHAGNVTMEEAHSMMLEMFAESDKANRFTRPFLAIIAYRLYDGSYIYASQPALLCPRDLLTLGAGNTETWSIAYDGTETRTSILQNSGAQSDYTAYVPDVPIARASTIHINSGSEVFNKVHARKTVRVINTGTSDTVGTVAVSEYAPVYENGYSFLVASGGSTPTIVPLRYHARVNASDLVVSIENKDFFDKYNDVITGIGIFVTKQADIYDMSAEGYKKSPFYNRSIPNNNATYFRTTESVYIKDTSNPSAEEQLSSYDVEGYTYFPKKRTFDEIKKDLFNSPFYLLREYGLNEMAQLYSNPVVDLSSTEYKEIVSTELLVQQKYLLTEAFSRTTYLPKVSYMYNGRLHIANYKSYPFFGYPIDLFHLHNHSVKVQDGSWFKGVLRNLADNNDEYLQYAKTSHNFPSTIPSGCTYFAFIEVTIDSSQGEQKVVRYIEPYAVSNGQNGRADYIESLNPLITYPDARAKQIRIVRYASRVGSHAQTFALKPHPYLNMAYYIDPNLKPIDLVGNYSMRPLPEMQNTEEYFPNVLKVSMTDQPMFFPVENTYQVGSAEILALMSNTIAVGTGQTGDAPLYVFCKDGVYALYVDSSGQMAYPNARILARDVCNNPRSVTPIDAGVVFTTDRGLMMIAGEQVEEIGQPAEGDVLQYVDSTKVDYSKYAFDALTKIAGLPRSLCDTTDFLTYLQDKGTSGNAAIINYNHNMRELMVSNPNYTYSYVLDRDGNWSRRDYTAAQYVNNYPTSYRVDKFGHFYKVDDEGDANTSLEHRKEADNQIFYLSNVIKLDSIGFKQAYRFVVRGYFETTSGTKNVLLGSFQKPRHLYDSNILYNLDIAIYNSLDVGDTVMLMNKNGNGSIQTLNVESKMTGPNRIELSGDIQGDTGDYYIYKVDAVVDNAIACVVEGSYDGRKFAPLGFNRKSGKFTNIGCHVSHTDVRFYRVILCGQVTGKTRIDYMEISADGSKLNTKIR